MEALVRAGVDIALAILVVEALLLLMYRSRTGRGLPISSILLITSAGFALILALRFALHGGSTMAIALALLLGGLAHGIDLTRRLTKRE